MVAGSGLEQSIRTSTAHHATRLEWTRKDTGTLGRIDHVNFFEMGWEANTFLNRSGLEPASPRQMKPGQTKIRQSSDKL